MPLCVLPLVHVAGQVVGERRRVRCPTAYQRDRHLHRCGQHPFGEFRDPLQDVVETDLAELDTAEFGEGVSGVRRQGASHGTRSSRPARPTRTCAERADGSSRLRAAAWTHQGGAGTYAASLTPVRRTRYRGCELQGPQFTPPAAESVPAKHAGFGTRTSRRGSPGSGGPRASSAGWRLGRVTFDRRALANNAVAHAGTRSHQDQSQEDGRTTDFSVSCCVDPHRASKCFSTIATGHHKILKRSALAS